MYNHRERRWGGGGEAMSAERLYRLVVLPATGIVMSKFESAQIEWSEDKSIGWEAFLSDSIGLGLEPNAPAVLYASDRALKRTVAMRVLANFHADGPKLAMLAPEAERMLRASGYRMVRETRYRLTSDSQPVAIDDGEVDARAGKDFLRRLYPPAERRNLGKGVTVGVIDTGVDLKHPGLADAASGGRTLVPGEDDDDGAPAEGPRGGHGTHVAGIIAGYREGGPMGVAPGAQIRSYRVFPKHDVDKGAPNIAIIDAIRAAVDDECQIINLSLSGITAREDGLRDAIAFAWEQGVLCIAAAGNRGRKPVGYPAAHPHCVAISALGHTDTIPEGDRDLQTVAAPFSEVEPKVFVARFSNKGPQIDFAAPGVHIVSTMPGGGYAAMSGTSMAAPAVAGAAAIALSQDRDIMGCGNSSERALALYRRLVSMAKPFRFGSFDYEGYGVPHD